MAIPSQILHASLLPSYSAHIETVKPKFDALGEAEISTNSFSFYTAVASVYSGKIEGEPIGLDSYIKHKAMGLAFEPDYTQKTDD